MVLQIEKHFHPKRYLFDLGIAKHLRETAIAPISLLKTLEVRRRTPLGGMIENMVLHALLSQTKELAGWKKSSSGSEVDFVVKTGDVLVEQWEKIFAESFKIHVPIGPER